MTRKICCLLLLIEILFLSACAATESQPPPPSLPATSTTASGQPEQTSPPLPEPEAIGNPMECSFRLETIFDEREKEYYLYVPPVSCGNQVLLLFDPDTNRETGSNTMLLDMDTGEKNRLPYTTESIQMDKAYFYWLGVRPKPGGGGCGQIFRAQRDTPEETELLYETPEEWVQDTDLFCGDGFLVWGEYKVNEHTGNIEKYRVMAFDLEKHDHFEVGTINNYYEASTFLSINSGMIAYGADPLYGYDLRERKIVAEQPCGTVKSAVYDGTYFAYVEAEDKEQLILTMPGTSIKRVLAGQAVNADIVKGEFVIYSTNGGLYVYSISKDSTVFYTRSPSDEPGFNFGQWFHADKETGTTLFKNIIKGNSEKGPATTASALFMDFQL